MEERKHDLKAVFSQFAIEGEYIGHKFLKVGHINDTYLVDARYHGVLERYIFQKINHFVFRDPEKLMSNFERITEHIRAKVEKMPGKNPDRETLHLARSRSGKSYHLSFDGDIWRAYRYVSDCHIIEIAKKPDQAYEAGRAFGCFQKLLSDFPASSLHETIPFFHHTPRRFARFKEVLEQDQRQRAVGASEAIAFVIRREPMMSVITSALEDGSLPLRITHNDTKINNILFDDRTEKAICIIDLDTTMPGSALYDFGDMVRTTTSFAAEDEKDLTRVKMEMPMFQALAAGYLEEAADFLTEKELELLVFSGRLITLTIGLRFLTDYLEGDVYFRIHRPGQNLDRAKVQFALVKSMEDQEEEMEKFILSLRQKAKRSFSGCLG